MAYNPADQEEAQRDDLIDRLRAHDIRYLGGGSAWSGRQSAYTSAQDVPVGPLLDALARSGDPRIRTAIVALLLRHPEYAGTAERLAHAPRAASGTARLLAVCILAAAALQRMWKFSLDLYLPGWSEIDATRLARELGVPLPMEEYGRATLEALEALLQAGDPFPTAYRAAWEDVGRHVLDDMREEQRDGAA